MRIDFSIQNITLHGTRALQQIQKFHHLSGGKIGYIVSRLGSGLTGTRFFLTDVHFSDLNE